MTDRMFFYDKDGKSVDDQHHASSFRCITTNSKGETIQEQIGQVGNEPTEKCGMAPSALDKLPYLDFTGIRKEAARDYKAEYREYHGKPSKVKERAQRNAARAKLGLKRGDPREADHKHALSDGGSNSPRNLRAVSRETNRKKGAKKE